MTKIMLKSFPRERDFVGGEEVPRWPVCKYTTLFHGWLSSLEWPVAMQVDELLR